MGGLAQFFAELWKILKENVSTIALLIFNYEEYKIFRANREKADALLDAKLKENKNEIDKKYAGKSDSDVVDEFLNGPEPSDSATGNHEGGSPKTGSKEEKN